MLILPAGVVWLASYPRSGNTWIRILLSNLLEGKGVPGDINNFALKGESANSVQAFEELTLLDSDLLKTREIEALRPTVHDAESKHSGEAKLLKTHDAYTYVKGGTPLLGRAARAAIYLVRDPRDVAVSFAAHFGIGIDAAIRRMNDQDDTIGGFLQTRQRLTGWTGHVTSWLDQLDLPVHVIRYEDLHADTSAVFAAALDFLGANYTRHQLEQAVVHSGFAELRRQERENGFCESLPAETLFFRRGETGSWRQELTATQIGVIESDHAITMKRLGYLRAAEMPQSEGYQR